MSSEKTENPVLLWGDMGPDVYKLSQIYDPRNDKYVTTQDTSLKKIIKEGTEVYKDYYERLDMILTTDTSVDDGKKYFKRIVNDIDGSVTFEEVPTAERFGANPAANKWYQDSGGKIKVFSKVDLSKWPATVNPYLPYGAQGKDEKDWIHWYEVNEGAENTCGKYVPAVDSLVVVDETECYYKTENKYKTRMLLTVKSVDYALNVEFATVVFGTDIEETTRSIDYGNEKFMLFFNRKTGASFDNILLTPDRKVLLYGKDSYAYRLKRGGVIISKNKPTIQLGDDAFIPFARAAAKKFTITEDNFKYLKEKLPYINIVLPTGFQRTMNLAKSEQIVHITDPEAMDIIHTCDIVFREGVVYRTKSGTAINSSEYAYGSSILQWEKNDPAKREIWVEVKEDLLGRTCYALPAKTSSVPSSCVFVPESGYLRSNFSIVDGEPILMEIFTFDTETREAHLIMTLTLTSREATALDATDVTTRQIVKFDVELNGYDDLGDMWYLQQGEDWKEVFHMVPKISFDDGSDLTVPVDGKTCYRYGFEDVKSSLIGHEYHVLFKFFPHKTLNVDWQKMGMTPTKNYLVCRKTIKIINNLAYKIRKISLIPAWNQNAQWYVFYFMIFRNDFLSPDIIKSNLDTKYMIETYKVTEDTTVQADRHYYDRQNSGYFTLRTGLAIGTPIASLPHQPVYERTLQPKTSLDDVQYLNANGDVQYVAGTSAGANFDVTQRAKLSEKVTIRGMNAESIYTQDVRFRLQNMMLNDKSPTPGSRLPYKWLIGDDHTSYEGETMPYGKVPKRPYLLYTLDHTELSSTVGQYRVDDREFGDTEMFLKSFYYASQPPRGVSEDGAIEADEFVPTHFFIRPINDNSAATEFIEITEGSKAHCNPVLLEGGGTSEKVIGGAIPCKIDDPIYGQGAVKLMGTVIVQFVHRYQDPDDPRKYLYKHLYAVPVETRDTAWDEEEE